MVRGLYTAYTGMRNEQRRLDIISNNLANSATIGYKEENVTSRSFKDMMAVKIRDGSVGYVDQNIGTMNLGVKIGETYMDWRGIFERRGIPMILRYREMDFLQFVSQTNRVKMR